MTVTAGNTVKPVIINNNCIIKVSDITTTLSSDEISEENLATLRGQLSELLELKSTSFSGFQDIHEYLEHYKGSDTKGKYFDHQCEVAFRFEADIEKVEALVDHIAAHALTFTLLTFIPNQGFTKAVRSWRVSNVRIAARIHDLNVRDLSKSGQTFGLVILIRHLMDVDGNYPLVVDRDTKWGTEALERMNSAATYYETI